MSRSHCHKAFASTHIPKRAAVLCCCTKPCARGGQAPAQPLAAVLFRAALCDGPAALPTEPAPPARQLWTSPALLSRYSSAAAELLRKTLFFSSFHRLRRTWSRNTLMMPCLHGLLDRNVSRSVQFNALLRNNSWWSQTTSDMSSQVAALWPSHGVCYHSSTFRISEAMLCNS